MFAILCVAPAVTVATAGERVDSTGLQGGVWCPLNSGSSSTAMGLDLVFSDSRMVLKVDTSATPGAPGATPRVADSGLSIPVGGVTGAVGTVGRVVRPVPAVLSGVRAWDKLSQLWDFSIRTRVYSTAYFSSHSLVSSPGFSSRSVRGIHSSRLWTPRFSRVFVFSASGCFTFFALSCSLVLFCPVNLLGAVIFV